MCSGRRRPDRPDRPRSAAAAGQRRRAACSALRKIDTLTSADRGLQRHDRQRRRGPRAGRRWASPATSTNTRRCSTSCRHWRRTSSPTTTTAARARASCSASRSSYRFGNTIAAALTLNISHGGLAVRTTSPLDGRHDAASCASGCPPARRTSTPKRRVAWVDRRVGMGLQFTKIDAGDQTRDRRLRAGALLLESQS